MAALTSAPYVALLTYMWISAVTASSEEIKAKSGDDATLKCQSHRDAAVILIEWTRPDLKTDDYVFFFRENQQYERYQHPSFRGRVQLKDPEMKDGDFSVILNDVTINDTGTYECYGSAGSSRRRKRANDFSHTIKLTVEDSGQTAGDTTAGGKTPGHTDMRAHTGVTVTGLIVLVGLVGLVGLVIFKKSKGHLKNITDQPVDEAGVHQQLQENENSESKTITHYTSDIQV